MFDDFRDQVDESDFEEPESTPEAPPEENAAPPQYFLGMTPVQRFIIALELLFVVCLSGALILLVMGRIELPF